MIQRQKQKSFYEFFIFKSKTFSLALFSLIFFLLVLQIVSAQNISIDNYNWTFGENKLLINFSFAPSSVSFNYPNSFTYKILNQINETIYEATFLVEEYGNHSLEIVTNLVSKSFLINLERPVINETVNNTNQTIDGKTTEEIIKERVYPFNLSKEMFWLLLVIGIVFILVISGIVILIQKSSKIASK